MEKPVCPNCAGQNLIDYGHAEYYCRDCQESVFLDAAEEDDNDFDYEAIGNEIQMMMVLESLGEEQYYAQKNGGQ